MSDRCDTPEHWFLFATCGRPFFFCEVDPTYGPVIAQLRRKWRGVTLTRRKGNYAAATIEEVRTAWPDPQINVGADGSFVYVVPHEVHS